jgi:hypothetical protein
VIKDILATSSQLAVIVIPLYKEKLSAEERTSLHQGLKILSGYPVYFITHRSLDLSEYQQLLNENTIKLAYFEEFYFNGIEGYNRLMLSTEFYQRFLQFKFMLVYQLDAYVFTNELEKWCSFGYDYIGPPWLHMDMFRWLAREPYPKRLYYLHKYLGKGRHLSTVGNGGFSLRKIRSCLFNLNLFRHAASNWKVNEDSFFAHYVKTFNPFFRIPPLKIALQFGFDNNPLEAYEMNGRKLPFGCHAWYKTGEPYVENLEFWSQFIK